MDLYQFGSYVGVYAPVILFILTVFLLINKQIFLKLYISGFVINVILNMILKIIIKDPRPSNDQKTIEIGVFNGSKIGPDKFGMPSGHAQNCGYCLSFITMVLNNPNISIFYLLISFISMCQRYIYKNHNIFQLFIGFLIGGGFGIFIYSIGNKYLIGNIKLKKDDNARI